MLEREREKNYLSNFKQMDREANTRKRVHKEASLAKSKKAKEAVENNDRSRHEGVWHTEWESEAT